MSGGDVSGGQMSGGNVSGGQMPGGNVSGGQMPGGNVSGGEVSGGQMPGSAKCPVSNVVNTRTCSLIQCLHLLQIFPAGLCCLALYSSGQDESVISLFKPILFFWLE